MLNIIEELIKDDNQPCISVIIPTHRTSSQRMVDPLEVKHAVQKAKELLFLKHGSNGTVKMADKLDELVQETDFTHSDNGIGYFVSYTRAAKVNFSFPVKERIHVGQGFEVRELLWMAQQERPYYILSLSEKVVRLFWTSGKNLREVEDENFPLMYTDDHEYEKPSPGNSFSSSVLKSTEKDKSVMDQIRYTAFLKSLDGILALYLEKELPMVVAGVNKVLGMFNATTSHREKIAGEVSGNYQQERDRLLELSQEQMLAWYEQEEQKLMDKLDTAIGKKLASSGLQDIWQSAILGKGQILLVEKDFTSPGFIIPEEDLKLHLMPLPGKHEIIPDAVDAVIKIVLSKNGKVSFVQNGRLAEHGGIALIKRFE